MRLKDALSRRRSSRPTLNDFALYTVFFTSQTSQPYHNSIVEPGFLFIVNENNLLCIEVDHVVLVVSCMHYTQ